MKLVDTQGLALAYEIRHRELRKETTTEAHLTDLYAELARRNEASR